MNSVPRKRHSGDQSFAWGESLNLELVGRDDELARLDELLREASAGRSGSLLIAGDPGLGKSTLLREAERRAAGFRRLRVGGTEAEQVLSHAGLHQALGPLRNRIDEIPDGQAAALASALGWATATAPAERFLVAAATLSLLAAEAERGPVLVVVDDAHWIDRESLVALVFAARRLHDDTVCFLWASRPDPPTAALLGAIPALTLTGISRADARRLVAGRLDPEVADRLADDTGGNPLGLLEVARRLTDAQRVGTAPLPSRLPVGERLLTEYRRLLTGLSASAQHALLLCALDASGSTPTIRAALAANGARALDEVVDLAILVEDGPDLAFRHPLLRTAVLAVATAAQQRAAHLELAQAMQGRSDLLAAAWHRAEASTGSDPELAQELVHLAGESRRRHGYAAASAVLERAAHLAASTADAATHRAAAAADASAAGDVDRARRLAREALKQSDEPMIRGSALSLLGTAELATGSVPRAVELLSSACEVLDGALLVRALAELAQARFRLNDVAGLVDCADRMAGIVDRDDPELAMLTDFTGGAAAAMTGELATAQGLIAAVIEQIARPPLRDDPRSLPFLAMAAAFAGDVAPVFTLGEHLLALTRERGAFGVLVPALALTAAGRSWIGDNDGAFADAGEATELGEQLGYAVDVANAWDMVAWQSAARGLHDDAAHALLRSRELLDRAGTTAAAAHLALTEAFCALSRADPERAVGVLESRLAADGGVGATGEPLGIAPDLVEAYVATGRREQAVDLANRFADATAAEAPSLTRALVERTQGLATLDDTASAAAFERALIAHAEGTHPFEAARTRLTYGARLRRDGRRVRARAQLEQARDSFAAMNLGAWVERANGELAASGASARKRELFVDEPLTSQELRVALHAARGASNKEIAAALFLSPKTIERHLSSVYRKRGLRSRTELAAAFVGGSELA